MKMMKNAVEEKAYENQEAYQRTQMQKDMILERLREQGCRITRQRQLILDIILEEECSCCKEIYYKVQEKDRNIGHNLPHGKYAGKNRRHQPKEHVPDFQLCSMLPGKWLHGKT